MKKFSFITLVSDGERIHLNNVLIGIIYIDNVAILKVQAELSQENMFELITKGVEFIRDENNFIIDFCPMSLESTRK
jgi:hypothetical protein